MPPILHPPDAPLKPPRQGRARLFALAGIAALLAVVAGAFAWAAGWLSPGRLGPTRIVNALEAHDGRHEGFRRAHAKGLCFSGWFDSNGAGAELSRASVFQPGRYPVVGRFSTGGGIPDAGDSRKVFHSMALSFSLPHGEQWRTGMDHTPIFPVATPQAFYEFQQATTPDPKTGKPDPARVKAYLEAHPETRAFMQWMDQHPLPASFAVASYYSINAFRFTDHAGAVHNVRWSTVPEAPFEALDSATLPGLPRDFLFDDIIARLKQAPARWHLLLTIGEPGDPTNDATKQWPDDRRSIDAGILTVERPELEEDGACRDITFDPLILPSGIEASDDPLLAARSAAYSTSLTRRAGEPAPHSALGQAAAHATQENHR